MQVVVVDYEITNKLAKSFRVLLSNADINNLIKQLGVDSLNWLIFSDVLGYLLKVLFLWSHSYCLQHAFVYINRKVHLSVGEDVANKEVLLVLSVCSHFLSAYRAAEDLVEHKLNIWDVLVEFICLMNHCEQQLFNLGVVDVLNVLFQTSLRKFQ